MKRTALAPMSAKKLEAAGAWAPYSTLTSTAGLSRSRMATKPKPPRETVDKLPMILPPWREAPELEPEPAPAALSVARKRPKDTGPTKATRDAVKARDKRCIRCGREVLHGTAGQTYSIQHILGRGAGGTSDPQVNDVDWLALLCGDGSSGCHGEVEGKYRRRAYREGHARKRTAVDRHLHTLKWHGRRCRFRDGRVFDARTGQEVWA